MSEPIEPQFYTPWPKFGAKHLKFQWGEIRSNQDTLAIMARAMGVDQNSVKFSDSALQSVEVGDDGFHNRWRTIYDNSNSVFAIQRNIGTTSAPIWESDLTIDSDGKVSNVDSDFYLTVKQSNDKASFGGLQIISFESDNFYITQNASNTNEVQVSFRGSTEVGEDNTGSSLGGDTNVFKQKTGVDLEFRGLSAGSNIEFTEGSNFITIDSVAAGGFYIVVKHADDSTVHRDISVLAFNQDTFYLTQNPTNTDESLVNMRDVFRLGGSPGGQRGHGGTGASEDLFFTSTSHATKGFIDLTDQVRMDTDDRTVSDSDVEVDIGKGATFTYSGTTAINHQILDISPTLEYTGAGVIDILPEFIRVTPTIKYHQIPTGFPAGLSFSPQFEPQAGANLAAYVQTGILARPTYDATSATSKAINTMIGFHAQPRVQGTGSVISNADGFRVQGVIEDSGVISNLKSIRILDSNENASVGGSVTTHTGLKIDNLSNAATSWSMQVGTAPSYHSGKITFGGTSVPNYDVEVQGSVRITGSNSLLFAGTVGTADETLGITQNSAGEFRFIARNQAVNNILDLDLAVSGEIDVQPSVPTTWDSDFQILGSSGFSMGGTDITDRTLELTQPITGTINIASTNGSNNHDINIDLETNAGSIPISNTNNVAFRFEDNVQIVTDSSVQMIGTTSFEFGGTADLPKIKLFAPQVPTTTFAPALQFNSVAHKDALTPFSNTFQIDLQKGIGPTGSGSDLTANNQPGVRLGRALRTSTTESTLDSLMIDANQLGVADGTSTRPGICFNDEFYTGFFRNGNNSLGVTVASRNQQQTPASIKFSFNDDRVESHTFFYLTGLDTNVDASGGGEVPHLSRRNTWNATQTVRPKVLTGTSITPDCNDSNQFHIELEGDTTMNAASNIPNGGTFIFYINNPSTHTVTWNAAYLFPNGGGNPNQTENAADVITFVSINGVLHGTFVQNFA